MVSGREGERLHQACGLGGKVKRKMSEKNPSGRCVGEMVRVPPRIGTFGMICDAVGLSGTKAIC